MWRWTGQWTVDSGQQVERGVNRGQRQWTVDVDVDMDTDTPITLIKCKE
jgi:hypothetical protein